MRRLSIAIAGAGIGGLALAALLRQGGHQVTVFDQFETPKPVGSGLVIQPVGQAVLDEIGIGERARAHGAGLKRMLGRESESGRRVLDVWYTRKGEPEKMGLAIHRGALFHLLLKSAQQAGADIETGWPVTGREGQRFVSQSGQRSARFDLLVDASGAGSQLSPLKSRPLPFGALWTTVPWPEETDLQRDQINQRYRRAEQAVGVMPCGHLPGDETQLATLFWNLPIDAYRPWRDQDLESWKADVTQMWPETQPFVAPISAHDQMIFATYSHGTLRRPWSDGLVHIGDAAHRASPQLGQGANMALLDALALARALEMMPPGEAVPAAAAARRWHMQIYQWMSWAFTPQYQSRSRLLPIIRDNILLPLSLIPPMPGILGCLVRGELLPAVRVMYE